MRAKRFNPIRLAGAISELRHDAEVTARLKCACVFLFLWRANMCVRKCVPMYVLRSALRS